MDLEKLKYPIGKWSSPEVIDSEMIIAWIADIASVPGLLSNLVNHGKDVNLALTYRNGGWTIRQLVHHLADSHINAYVRHKLAASEQTPIINPYNEGLWSVMKDVKDVDVQISLQLLDALHQRWTVFLSSLSHEELKKSFFHPGHNRLITLGESIGMYSWHGKHHLAHITLALGQGNY